MAFDVKKPASESIPPNGIPSGKLEGDWREDYAPERIAEYLLNNAVGKDVYAAALEEVRRLGIDPATIPHEPPTGV